MGSTASQATNAQVNNGTGNPEWRQTTEKETSMINNYYQSISAMNEYKNWSVEVLKNALFYKFII